MPASDVEPGWVLLTAALERTLARAPVAAAGTLPRALRPIGWVAALLFGPSARLWAGALGGWLRSRPAVPPVMLRFLYPLWLEVGRYAGFVR